MKVFIVFQGEYYEGGDVVAAFTTHEKAYEHARAMPISRPSIDYLDILEIELDAPDQDIITHEARD
jgi:hypothetical protein